uniref:Ig-like domain-containing protein n=1 Tax=Varanus komodoensis TaxID=61221 RepID=A0A8D2Q6E0_VARKO
MLTSCGGGLCLISSALLHTDADLPRPVISISPKAVVSLGEEINFQCKTQDQPAKFYLQKAGDSILNWAMRSTRNVGDYSISCTSWEHAGHYSCSYALLQSPFLLSAPSDDIFLLLTKPRISISPSGSVALGAEVKIWCEIQYGTAVFYLYKAGDPTHQLPMKSHFNKGEFCINNVSWTHKGNYSCAYAFAESPFLFSPHSDLLELQPSGAVFVLLSSSLVLQYCIYIPWVGILPKGSQNPGANTARIEIRELVCSISEGTSNLLTKSWLIFFREWPQSSCCHCSMLSCILPLTIFWCCPLVQKEKRWYVPLGEKGLQCCLLRTWMGCLGSWEKIIPFTF